MSDARKIEEFSAELPNVYFNGFQISLSNADVNGVLMLNNQPIFSLSMSYTTTKTLAIALNDMVQTLEKVTGREIMTTKDVGSGIEQLIKKDGNGQPN